MTEEQYDRKPEKQKYAPPVLLELGALAKGVGGSTCTVGTNPSGTPCTPGVAAQALCTVGTAVI